MDSNQQNYVDWNMESLSKQDLKENFPVKNDKQSFRDTSFENNKAVDWSENSSKKLVDWPENNKKESIEWSENNAKKSVDWSHDSSFLPINLNGVKVTDSPITNRNSIFNERASSSGAPDLHSQVSLDYSLDTAGDGSLIGGQFAGDASVFTTGTTGSDNKSLLSYVTRSTIHDMTGKNKIVASSPKSNREENDDDTISLSLMASTSSGMELIPTDDDLFAIGWAKAMDPNSGSYYYFTLDRSKTVWDNPLSTRSDP